MLKQEVIILDGVEFQVILIFRQFFYQVLSFGMIVSSALMIWKGLMVVTGSESPIVVVLSGSMEPAFHRGDLLFLTNYEAEDIRVGEIVVFKVSVHYILCSKLKITKELQEMGVQT